MIDGVLRTRTGYAGGRSTDPSYKNLEWHTEVVEIDYDPAVISYEDLVALFFAFHDENLRPYDQRVKSLIFFRSEAEETHARQAISRQREVTGKPVFTEAKEMDVFYLAEPEHQNRTVKREVSLYGELTEIFETDDRLQQSILVSKLNGFVYGYGSPEDLEDLLNQLGLSDMSKGRVREIHGR